MTRFLWMPALLLALLLGPGISRGQEPQPSQDTYYNQIEQVGSLGQTLAGQEEETGAGALRALRSLIPEVVLDSLELWTMIGPAGVATLQQACCQSMTCPNSCLGMLCSKLGFIPKPTPGCGGIYQVCPEHYLLSSGEYSSVTMPPVCQPTPVVDPASGSYGYTYSPVCQTGYQVLTPCSTPPVCTESRCCQTTSGTCCDRPCGTKCPTMACGRACHACCETKTATVAKKTCACGAGCACAKKACGCCEACAKAKDGCSCCGKCNCKSGTKVIFKLRKTGACCSGQCPATANSLRIEGCNNRGCMMPMLPPPPVVMHMMPPMPMGHPMVEMCPMFMPGHPGMPHPVPMPAPRMAEMVSAPRPVITPPPVYVPTYEDQFVFTAPVPPTAPVPCCPVTGRTMPSRTAACIKVTAKGKRVHIVTPRFEARCDSIRHVENSDRMVLEGKVRLTMRTGTPAGKISAEGVEVGLHDGTFRIVSGKTGPQTVQKPTTHRQQVERKKVAPTDGVIPASGGTDRNQVFNFLMGVTR